MNNAFLGKTMENARDRVNIEFLDHSETQRMMNRQRNGGSLFHV